MTDRIEPSANNIPATWFIVRTNIIEMDFYHNHNNSEDIRDWCRDQYGVDRERWRMAPARNGLVTEIDYINFGFLNENDALFFKMRWSDNGALK